MSKALQFLNEFSATHNEVPASMLKSGDQVIYKSGDRLEGLIGLVVNVRQGKVDLKIGNATRVDVEISRLNKLERSA